VTGLAGFAEIAPDVYVLRYPVLDVNSTLVLGQGAALVVDTLSTDAQAAALLDAVRRITPAPLSLVNTHHHFDHCFGNALLADAADSAASPADIWAAEEAARLLAERGKLLQQRWYEEWAPIDPELASGLAAVTVRPPNRTVRREATVDIGGRVLVLRHLGRGHTEGDLVVEVPDAAVLIAGDLIENGGPPTFEDAYPLEWPQTVAALLLRCSPGTVVVPGHGAPVDQEFVRAQHADLTALEWLIRDGHADGATVAEVATKGPFEAKTTAVAVARGYAELSGRV
jgi:glyoxylase-like metal-dependent hydrolase (beta-lactamase superfamily II)